MKILITLACLLITVSAFPSKDIHQPALTNSGRNGRIYGGRNAEDGEFPFIVSITYVYVAWSSRHCSGSILSETKILGAGNCQTSVPGSGIGTYTVYAGLTNLDRMEYQQAIKVASWVTHPDWSPRVGGGGPNDIMMFTLSEPLTFNARVAPISLPEIVDELPTGRVVLAGWGRVFGGEQPRDLQKVDLEIEPLSICRASLEALIGPSPLDPSDTGSNICTSGGLRSEEPISICSGDLGSPLVDLKGEKPVLVGIVSWGINPCGTPTAPSIYTKVSHFLSWIAENM